MFIDQDNRLWDVTNMLDDCGDDTEDPSEAVVLVLNLKGDPSVWLALDLREYDWKPSYLN